MVGVATKTQLNTVISRKNMRVKPINSETAKKKGYDRCWNWVFIDIVDAPNLSGYYDLAELSMKEFNSLLLLANKANYGNQEYESQYFNAMRQVIKQFASSYTLQS